MAVAFGISDRVQMTGLIFFGGEGLNFFDVFMVSVLQTAKAERFGFSLIMWNNSIWIMIIIFNYYINIINIIILILIIIIIFLQV